MNTYRRNAARTIPGPRRIRPSQNAERPTYVLTRDEAAKELRISRDGLMNLVNAGDIPSFTIGTRRLFRRSDLEAYVDRAVGTGYTLKLPQNLGECQIAARTCEREADHLNTIAKQSTDSEHVRYCHSAAQAFAVLAMWYRWNSGEFEQEAGAA